MKMSKTRPRRPLCRTDLSFKPNIFLLISHIFEFCPGRKACPGPGDIITPGAPSGLGAGTCPSLCPRQMSCVDWRLSSSTSFPKVLSCWSCWIPSRAFPPGCGTSWGWAQQQSQVLLWLLFLGWVFSPDLELLAACGKGTYAYCMLMSSTK